MARQRNYAEKMGSDGAHRDRGQGMAASTTARRCSSFAVVWPGPVQLHSSGGVAVPPPFSPHGPRRRKLEERGKTPSGVQLRKQQRPGVLIVGG